MLSIQYSPKIDSGSMRYQDPKTGTITSYSSHVCTFCRERGSFGSRCSRNATVIGRFESFIS